MSIVIGIADCSKYTNYDRWMLEESGVTTIKLGVDLNNLDDLKKCQGVLLTGGEDVAPKFYGKPEYLKYCESDNMDERRDEFELKMLAYTQENKMPVLGICRGLQIANVFFGGTLIPDIPSFGKSEHSKFSEGLDRYHEIRINPYCKLKSIAGVDVAEVNSAHHQAADKIGNGLLTGAFSADGVVEALERKSSGKIPYMLLVQWHPERMKNKESNLSKAIKKDFLEAVKTHVK